MDEELEHFVVKACEVTGNHPDDLFCLKVSVLRALARGLCYPNVRYRVLCRLTHEMPTKRSMAWCLYYPNDKMTHATPSHAFARRLCNLRSSCRSDTACSSWARLAQERANRGRCGYPSVWHEPELFGLYGVSYLSRSTSLFSVGSPYVLSHVMTSCGSYPLVAVVVVVGVLTLTTVPISQYSTCPYRSNT